MTDLKRGVFGCLFYACMNALFLDGVHEAVC